MSEYKHRNDCRLCGSTSMELVLPILPSPIGDAFIDKNQLNEVQSSYPLDTYLCNECGHLQNLDIVDPELLFRNYTYETSVSLGLVQHFKGYAESVEKKFNLQPNSLIVEIGSNDGSLLSSFRNLGMRVLGVDPAKDIAKKATLKGIKTIPEFFSEKIAKEILIENSKAKVVCANNVFAHADNIGDIVSGIKLLLDTDGVFVFEVSYVLDMIDGMVFDTIYHEHVSHHALIPLEKFFNKFGMSIFDVEKISTKGGSIRGFAQLIGAGSNEKTKRYLNMIDIENSRRVCHPEIYRDFYAKIEKSKNEVLKKTREFILSGKKVVAYGASTTATTLLYHFELQNLVSVIYDDNPLKSGLYSPGAHLPVKSSDQIYKDLPDMIVILAWQYAEVIVDKHRKYVEQGGQFLVPLPSLRTVKSFC